MEGFHKTWNQQQNQLRHLLTKTGCVEKAVDLFMLQHAALHNAAITINVPWSFTDEIIEEVSEERLRHLFPNSPHSIVWCFWHMARIEDVTMNVLVAGCPQMLHQDSWLAKMNVTTEDTGNEMDLATVSRLSAMINIEALLDYRLAVGRQTRQIVSELNKEQLNQPVDQKRLQNIVDQGAVPANSGLLSYWGNRTIAGLLLMPPTRHNFIHLNEALKLKNRRIR